MVTFVVNNKNFVLNLIYNIIGYVFPFCFGLFSIPVIIKVLGVSAFGFLSVAWVIIGYFSIFDLGLGRALTQAIATRLANDRNSEIYSLVRKALVVMIGLSMIGGCILALLSITIIDLVLKVPADFRDEALRSMWVLGFGIPAVVLFSGFRGILEAFGRFDVSSAGRSVLGIWTFVSPLLLFSVTKDLMWIVIVLVCGRYVVLVAFGFFCISEFRTRGLFAHRVQTELREIMAFGGWMTVSNIVSPIMVYMDRFFVSSISGLSQVAYYATPYDFISRLNFIPEAIFGVVFPAMAKLHAEGSGRAIQLYTLSLKILGFAIFLTSSVLVLVSPLFLRLWLGPEFEAKSQLIFSFLAIGLFVNCMARPSYNLLQAQGLANRTAQLHLLELPVYVVALIVSLNYFGPFGAAVAWLVRASLDFILLTVVVHRETDGLHNPTRIITFVLIICLALVGLSYIMNLELRVACWVCLTGILFVLFVRLIVSAEEKQKFRQVLESIYLRRR
jgi:O-antigen/teichoic acid export membrane protein